MHSIQKCLFSLVVVLMYNALLKNPLSKPLVIRDERMGLNLWDLSDLWACGSEAQSNEQKGVNRKLNFHVWLFWLVLVGLHTSWPREQFTP